MRPKTEKNLRLWLITLASSAFITAAACSQRSVIPINAYSYIKDQSVKSQRETIGIQIDFLKAWDMLKDDRGIKEFGADLGLLLAWSALAWYGKNAAKEKFGPKVEDWLEDIRERW